MTVVNRSRTRRSASRGTFSFRMSKWSCGTTDYIGVYGSGCSCTSGSSSGGTVHDGSRPADHTGEGVTRSTNVSSDRSSVWRVQRRGSCSWTGTRSCCCRCTSHCTRGSWRTAQTVSNDRSHRACSVSSRSGSTCSLDGVYSSFGS